MPTSASIPAEFPFTDSFWLFEIVLGLLVLVALSYLFKKVIKHVRQKSLSSAPSWKQKVDHIFVTPFQILLWLLGVILVIEVLAKRFEFAFFDSYLNAFRSTGVVFCTAWMLLRWMTEFRHDFVNSDRHGKRVDAGFMHVIGKVVAATIVVLSLLIAMQVWGLDIAPLIAFGGIGVAAIAFAAKDVIANFFGGLMLYINRPFVGGDQIFLPDRNLEGHVEEIGWYLTSVRDREKRPVYLPNSLFSSLLVVNISRMTHRKVIEKIQLQIIDFSKLARLKERIQAAIAANPGTDAHLPILVTVNPFCQQSVEIALEFYTLQTRYEKYLPFKEEIMLSLFAVAQQEGAEVAIPSLSVQLQNAAALLRQ